MGHDGGGGGGHHQWHQVDRCGVVMWWTVMGF